MKRLVYKLKKDRTLLAEEFYSLLAGYDEETLSCINREARKVSLSRFGNKIYIRGLIEISNCCKNDCYYCGIRKSNRNIERYRMIALWGVVPTGTNSASVPLSYKAAKTLLCPTTDWRQSWHAYDDNFPAVP